MDAKPAVVVVVVVTVVVVLISINDVIYARHIPGASQILLKFILTITLERQQILLFSLYGKKRRPGKINLAKAT